MKGEKFYEITRTFFDLSSHRRTSGRGKQQPQRFMGNGAYEAYQFFRTSLDAVDHYHRYEEDIKLLADAGLNAYRFSIEWARIEPEEGSFDLNEVEHYRDVIACCKKYGVEPFVTLHHFSSPKWLMSKGGWEAETTPADFAHYVHFIIEQLGSELHYI